METIAVIFGGRSAEHDISIITALASIIKPLELTGKYRVEPVYIAKDGAWYWDIQLKDIQMYTSGKIQKFIAHKHPVSICFDGGMTLVKNGAFGHQQRRKIDIVFPSMHGTYGEDGDLMGLIEMAGVPYIGCDVSASAIAMNKVLSKQVASANGILVSDYLTYSADSLNDELIPNVLNIEKKLKYPLFVKPAHLGSSIGISRATNSEELTNGLEVAAHYDDIVLVEEEIQNLVEVTLPIMGNEQPIPALLEQPLLKADDFFDFDTKYMQGGKKGEPANGTKGSQGYSKIPANLPKKLYAKAQQVGLTVYQALGCSGIARIDMLIDKKTGKVYFNEVNPLPGSLYSHNWRRAGVSNVELVEKLVGFGKEKFAKRRKLTTTFDTNFLQQFQ
jgi:D-alanine-D-alanine ligase